MVGNAKIKAANSAMHAAPIFNSVFFIV